MPKSSPSLSPASNISHSKSGPDDRASRMSDVALRKKKNADAQAAFRARRANYIATLEETVTSLESVVLQLQDSCREARSEAAELRQDKARLLHEFREREKLWTAFWQARKSGQGSESDDIPPLPPSFSAVHPPAGSMSAHLGPSHLNHYGNNGIPYRTHDDPSSVCNTGYNSATAGPSHGYQGHSPSMPYASPVNDHLGNNNSPHTLNHRITKFGPYAYPLLGPSREGPWPQAIAPSTSSGGDSGAPTHNSSHSPGFVESPTLTADMSYISRYPVDDHKVPMNSLEAAPYVFPGSRSLSPTTSSTPPSSSSTSLTSPFQFTFPENASHDRPEFDFRRQSSTHGAEVTLHGGSADISLASGNDAVRYRIGARQPNPGSDGPLLPALPPMSGSENGSQHERGSSDGEGDSYLQQRLRPRRSTAPSRMTSRSPSPGAPPLSGTLAVIKAQAFGALRRTRARTKRTSEGAAKVAMDVLEARGIGMGVGSKRPRLQDDDMQS